MPRPRSAMRKIREVLRLSLGHGLSRRQVGAAVGLPYTTVADHLGRARAAGLACSPRRPGRPRPGCGPCRTGRRSTVSCAGRG
jgi:transposase